LHRVSPAGLFSERRAQATPLLLAEFASAMSDPLSVRCLWNLIANLPRCELVLLRSGSNFPRKVATERTHYELMKGGLRVAVDWPGKARNKVVHAHKQGMGIQGESKLESGMA
jgi:hypothetical protein